MWVCLILMSFILCGELCIISEIPQELRQGHGESGRMDNHVKRTFLQSYAPLSSVFTKNKALAEGEHSILELHRRIRRTVLVWGAWGRYTWQRLKDYKISEIAWHKEYVNINATVAILHLQANNDPTDQKHCFLVFKHGYLKRVGPLDTEKAVKATVDLEFSETELKSKLLQPLWMTIPKDKRYEEISIGNMPDGIVPSNFPCENYPRIHCYKSPPESSGLIRYISIIKQHSELLIREHGKHVRMPQEAHAHYCFVSALLDPESQGPPQINYVSGFMNTAEMAEIAVLNFMNLKYAYRSGTWELNGSHNGTWLLDEYEIKHEPEVVQASIVQSVQDVYNLEKMRINFSGVNENQLISDLTYFVAIGTRHMPCPISPKDHLEFLTHSVDYYWISAQIPNSNGGNYVIVIVHKYLNGVYSETLAQFYGGYYNSNIKGEKRRVVQKEPWMAPTGGSRKEVGEKEKTSVATNSPMTLQKTVNTNGDEPVSTSGSGASKYDSDKKSPDVPQPPVEHETAPLSMPTQYKQTESGADLKPNMETATGASLKTDEVKSIPGIPAEQNKEVKTVFAAPDEARSANLKPDDRNPSQNKPIPPKIVTTKPPEAQGLKNMNGPVVIGGYYRRAPKNNESQLTPQLVNH